MFSARFVQVSDRILHSYYCRSCKNLPDVLQGFLARLCLILMQESCAENLAKVNCKNLAGFLQIPSRNLFKKLANSARKWPFYVQGSKVLASYARLFARQYIFFQQDYKQDLAHSWRIVLHGKLSSCVDL